MRIFNYLDIIIDALVHVYIYPDATIEVEFVAIVRIHRQTHFQLSCLIYVPCLNNVAPSQLVYDGSNEPSQL